MNSEPGPASIRKASIFQVAIGLALVAACVIATHWPALHAAGLSFDDDAYVGYNPLVTKPGWDSAWRFLSEVIHPSTIGGYYHPLPMISLMLDYAAGGREDHITPFRITSLAFHIGTTLGLALLIHLLFGRIWIAVSLALLYGVHPLTVEVVVWLAQRKAVMAAFFAVMSLCLYVLFVQRRRWSFYTLSIFAFALALLSKPSATPLPILFLLLDFWPFKRLSWRTALIEKIPFYIVGGAGALIIILSHTASLYITTPQEDIGQSAFSLLFYKLTFYWGKIFCPVNLSSYYAPPPNLSFSTPMVSNGLLGNLAIAAVCIFLLLKRNRVPLTCILFFFICLFPALGIFGFSWVFAQDNYLYLPMVGLILLLAGILNGLANRFYKKQSERILFAASLGCIVVCLAIVEADASRKYIHQWKDTLTLHEYMVGLAPRSARLRYNYGWVLADLGRAEDAENQYRDALALDPNLLDARYALGSALYLSNHFEEAVVHFREIVRIKPLETRAHVLLGHTLLRMGRSTEAAEAYRRALELDPNQIEARASRAIALDALGNTSEAVIEIRKTIDFEPNDSELWRMLSDYLRKMGRKTEADEALSRSQELNSAVPERKAAPHR